MRDIKFRALAPDKKGNLKWFDDVMTDGQEVWIYTKHQWIKNLKEIKALVQYTGLKDKNGVEMYEGDIVCNEGFKEAISWDDFYGWSVSDEGMLGEVNFARIKVIGNIYENKELLD